MVQWKQIQLASVRMHVRSLALLSGLGSGVAGSCGIGCRGGSDRALLWPSSDSTPSHMPTGAALKSEINK